MKVTDTKKDREQLTMGAKTQRSETENNPENELFQFAEETPVELPDPAKNSSFKEPWKILIADDEHEMHRMTKLVLNDLTYDNRQLCYLDAYSGKEAIEILAKNPDTAVLLLDVVMESDDAGLVVVQQVRTLLANPFVRIILRTGQPGKAPEKKLIIQLDINDYKEKTELTSQKLLTTIISALRTYRDLQVIEKNRRGLEKIIQASAFLLDNQSLRKFSEGMLTQLLSILNLDDSSLYVHQRGGFAAIEESHGLTILAVTGKFQDTVNHPIEGSIPAEIQGYIDAVLQKRQSMYFDENLVGYFETRNGGRNILFVSGVKQLHDLDIELISVFCNNVAIAYENIYLNLEIIDTQKEVILKIGDVVETRSKETANHVNRVAELSYMIGRWSGLSEDETTILRHASPMHDVGKVGIPDALLLKPGKLTKEEFEVIKTHTTIGYAIFNTSSRDIIKAAAIIAHEHHERWDGKGYPRGISGDAIHPFGRITALADVFDALSHRREYKEAWEMCQVLEMIQNEQGKHFDPTLVATFFQHIDEIIAINAKYPDA
ncbi:MAG: DUF3369 domain-containing protein [Chitinivibrionales bacterium]|nr:DUF3369 domain-containing protein [Chitinivibrionales bacterium]